MPVLEDKTKLETLPEELNPEARVVVKDPLMIAMLASREFHCRLSLDSDGLTQAEFAMSPKLSEMFNRFYTDQGFVLGARTLWDTCKELEWRILEKDIQ